MTALIICAAVITCGLCLSYTAALFSGRPEAAHRLALWSAISFAVTGLIDAMQGDWVAAAIEMASAAVWFWL